jgi:hypothetical protein
VGAGVGAGGVGVGAIGIGRVGAGGVEGAFTSLGGKRDDHSVGIAAVVWSG